jgi:hypothetical protein
MWLIVNPFENSSALSVKIFKQTLLLYPVFDTDLNQSCFLCFKNFELDQLTFLFFCSVEQKKMEFSCFLVARWNNNFDLKQARSMTKHAFKLLARKIFKL